VLLAARVDDLEEIIEESRCLERELSVVLVDIEHAPCARAFAESSAS